MSNYSFDQVDKEITPYRKSDYNIHPMFLNRWSPRAFSDRNVPDEKLSALFEAASWAPSGGNKQPWRYVIAKNETDKEKFKSFVNESNWKWCQHAPVLALLVSRKKSEDGRPINSYAFDAGTSWGYLALEALHQGLVVHAMGGFQKEKAKEVLSIPEEYECHVVIAIGYHGDKKMLSEKNQGREKPSNRIPAHQIVFSGTFGKDDE